MESRNLRSRSNAGFTSNASTIRNNNHTNEQIVPRNPLSLLNDLTVDNARKFQIVHDFIKSQGEIKDTNREQIVTKTQDYPIVNILELMLISEDWLASVTGPQIATCTNFYKELKIALTEEVPELESVANVTPTLLSNTQQRHNICQNLSGWKQPDTWFSVEDVEIWPIIILKNAEFMQKRKRNKTGPQQMKDHVDNLLDNTATDVGGVVETECGFSSLKIKCGSISDRSRLYKFFKENLVDWVIEMPTLRNPMIRLNKIRVIPDNETAVNEWLMRLKTRNGWTDADNKTEVLHIFRSKFKRETVDVILSVSPLIRERIGKRYGMVNVGSSMVRAVDYFEIKFCLNCCGYGHSALKCSLMSRCKFCSRNHIGRCAAESDKMKQRCYNCQKSGHSAMDNICSVYRIKLKHELEKTNFDYKFIMN